MRAASLTATLARAPAYARSLVAQYETDAPINHNQFTSNPGRISPNTAPGIAQLDALVNPDTLNWQAKANALASPTEFTGAQTPWASITNGTALAALIGTGQVAGTTLWPLVAPHVLNGF